MGATTSKQFRQRDNHRQLFHIPDGLLVDQRGDRFALSGNGWSGTIVAGSCCQVEDSGKYFDPSPFASSL